MMAKLARRLLVLSEEERRRMLDEYAPLMAVLQTLWHVVDSAAPEAEQPAVIRTFSSRSATREDVRKLGSGLDL